MGGARRPDFAPVGHVDQRLISRMRSFMPAPLQFGSAAPRRGSPSRSPQEASRRDPRDARQAETPGDDESDLSRSLGRRPHGDCRHELVPRAAADAQMTAPRIASRRLPWGASETTQERSGCVGKDPLTAACRRAADRRAISHRGLLGKSSPQANEGVTLQGGRLAPFAATFPYCADPAMKPPPSTRALASHES